LSTVALLTDFGLEDGFAGVLKGVILRINPNARIVDLSHNVKPFGILEGALILKAHYSYFPAGTVFVCVIDPGVGSEREALALECGDFFFVAPDNGILDLAIKDIDRPPKAVAIKNKRYLLPKRNNTFHGRDIFAPAGAYISAGIPISELGHEFQYRLRLEFPDVRDRGNYVEGQIVYFDRFGNAITNIPCERFSRGVFRGKEIEPADYFLAAPRGRLSFTCGSFGFIELFLPMDSARKVFKLNVKEWVRLYR
jgi:S-adenosylmethionine hydrolase